MARRCSSVTTSGATFTGESPVVSVRCELEAGHLDRHRGRVPGSHGVIWFRRRPPAWLVKALRGVPWRQRHEVFRRVLREQ